MKYASLSQQDRLPRSEATRRRGAPAWLVFGILLPLSLLIVGGAGWYVVTGEMPWDRFDTMVGGPHVDLPMPPPPIRREEPAPPQPTATAAAMSPIAPTGGETNANPVQSPVPPTAAATPRPTEPPSTATPTATPATTAPVAVAPPAMAPPAVATSPVVEPAPPAAPALPEPAMPEDLDTSHPPSFADLPSPKDEVTPLPAAPNPDLLRNSSHGALPIMAGGRSSEQAYARPFHGDHSKPRLAIIVTGLGLSKDATQAAIDKLPPDITLSFSPYGIGIKDWIQRAREAGHETMIDLPLETDNLQIHDPGPMAILSNHLPGEAIDRLEAILARGNSYVGVAAALHSPVTATESWGPMLQAIRDRGLLFVGDGLVGVPPRAIPDAATVTLVLDETPFRAAIDNHMTRLMMAAQRDGTAIGYLAARPVSFERLLAFLAQLPSKGVQLAPASAVVRPKP